jgi:hypothetical protein
MSKTLIEGLERELQNKVTPTSSALTEELKIKIEEQRGNKP